MHVSSKLTPFQFRSVDWNEDNFVLSCLSFVSVLSRHRAAFKPPLGGETAVFAGCFVLPCPHLTDE